LKLNKKFQSGNDYNMGQRDGFAKSDLQKLNTMYRCNIPSAPSGSSSGINRPPRPTYQKPNRPSGLAGGSSGGGNGGGNGGGGFTNPIANVINTLGGFFHALGGKHDETDETN
jgi:hypothetical protein